MRILYEGLKLLLTPEVWILVCLLGAWLLIRPPGHRIWGRRLLLSGIVLFWGLGSRPITHALLHPLEFHFAAPRLEGAPTQEALVVFGAGSAWQPEALLGRSNLDPLICGVVLLREGVAPMLLLAGGSEDSGDRGRSQAEWMRALAVQLGARPTSVLVEGRSRSTAERARAVRVMLPRARRIALVDSAAHLPRSALAFRREGFEVTPVPCDYRSSSAAWNLRDLLPTAEGLEDARIAVHEYMGLTFYWATGKL